MSDEVLGGQPAVDALLALLDLRQLGPYRYEGSSPPVGPQRVYGGQVAAQTLVAAGRTVDPARTVHSLQGYFVRPGDPSEPILYTVDNIRDGRSFSVRRCTAYQHDKTIFFMSASFHRAESGLDHHAPAPEVPPPDQLPTLAERLAADPQHRRDWMLIQQPLDVRYVGEPHWVRPGERPADSHLRVWLRVDGALPDDPLVHACALTYASDLTLLDSVLAAHGEVWGPGGMVGASLDHAMWFHRAPLDAWRADRWLLYALDSPSSSDARGYNRGQVFTEDGVLVASTMQEGLMRQR